MAAWLSLLRIRWTMSSLHVIQDELSHHISLLHFAPQDIKYLVRKGLERWQGRRVVQHLPELQPCSAQLPQSEAEHEPTLWTEVMFKIVKGARAIRREQELGALKVLWAGGSWEQARKHEAKLADSPACQCCGAPRDDKRHRRGGCVGVEQLVQEEEDDDRRRWL